MSRLAKFWGKLNRKKTIESDILETPLKRCLTTFDLTLLGIGHMIGAGIYVITGTVVKDKAGPAAMLSYAFAGGAAILSSLCYAEFGARVPKAGSAYSYTYVTVGEFWAFIIGWNIVLEHLIGLSSVARAWSGTLDSIFNGAIRNGTLTYIGHMGDNSKWISDYPDFFAVIVILLFMVLIICGAKISTGFNNVFTILNSVIMVFIIIGGFYFANSENWSDRGFLPFGFQGVFAGAASCFYAYIGFEGIAIASEEAKDPAKSIPIATITAMSVVTVLYVLVSTSLTLMVPYYAIDASAAYPSAFGLVGAQWLKYVVAIGSLFGITTSLVGSLFSLPRAIYAIAGDGLFFRIFARVHPKTQTPIVAIGVFGGLAAIMAMVFEMEALVEFMSIGTLMAYTIVAACIIILRYLPVSKCQFGLKPDGSDQGTARPSVPAPLEGELSYHDDPSHKPEADDDEMLAASDKSTIIQKSKSHDDFGRLKSTFKSVPFLKNVEPGNAAIGATLLMAFFMATLSALLMDGIHFIQAGVWWSIILLIIFIVAIVCCFLVIILHEQNNAFLTFQIPLVPLIPALSMFCNIALMLKLSYLTWIRLVIWLAIGFVIYFAYGMKHSRENRPLGTYNHLVSYMGDSDMGNNSLNKFKEGVHMQQPRSQGDTSDNPDEVLQ